MNIGATIPDNTAGDLSLMVRPFGANVRDFLSKPHEKGGLDFGIIGSLAGLAGIVLVMIVGGDLGPEPLWAPGHRRTCLIC